MDPTAVWTALGVVVAGIVSVCAIVVGVTASEISRLRRSNGELRQSNTDYLLRLADCDRERRIAEKSRNEANQLILALQYRSGKHGRNSETESAGQ